MDSYNRGYAPGISGLSDAAGEQIGNSTISNRLQDVSSTFESESEAAGFYAVAYNTDYGKVISYRGTDNIFNLIPWSDEPGGDFWNGWGTGSGSSNTTQAGLAVEFYQSVTGTSDIDPRTGIALLTGHSLGGGLAGQAAPAEALSKAKLP